MTDSLGMLRFVVETFYKRLQNVQGENADLLRDFAFRLDSRASKRGLSQSEIAQRLGTNTARVNHWFSGRNFPRAAERVRLADILGVNLDWLLKGEGEIEKSQQSLTSEDVGSPVREVPVISWSHAGEAATYEEMPKHWHGKVATTSRDRKAFAVTIEGDSMEPKFFTGDRVVLEPSSEPRNGKPVVAKFKADESVQLRIYTKMPDGKIQLAPYNRIYPTVDHSLAEFAWIYPVRELVRSV